MTQYNSFVQIGNSASLKLFLFPNQIIVKHQSGFICAKLLKSDDGIKVTAIAHWESAEQLAAMR
ncbi:hypothetical protein [Nostoc sp. T09]|uniref:hypothetical protein n=1 Tax=Nostoc sp. T09 TaxID=1932621 RepID=UPI000A37A3A3|nr:hypothetical protein [Nostoc sp. T09]